MYTSKYCIDYASGNFIASVQIYMVLMDVYVTHVEVGTLLCIYVCCWWASGWCLLGRAAAIGSCLEFAVLHCSCCKLWDCRMTYSMCLPGYCVPLVY